MLTKVHMEALSPTMEEGQIVKWLMAEGEAVSEGDVLAEVETDKAVMELVARGEGLLRMILLPEGGTAPVGKVIAVIAEADEDVSSFTGEAEVVEPVVSSSAAEVVEPVDDPDQTSSPNSVEIQPVADGQRIKASPVARKIASKSGLVLADISGSGPAGRIIKKDIEGVLSDQGAVSPGVVSQELGPEQYEDIPLTQMRKTIARRLSESMGPIPHFFLTVSVDMSKWGEARSKINVMLASEGVKISYNDIMIKATAAALAMHPECNAHWMQDSIRRFKAVHIGVATAVEDGLITPVIRNAESLSLREIHDEVRNLAEKAKNKSLTPGEYTGGTFSISNLGMFGIQEFTAVINPPEAAILAVGALEDHRLKLTMSCDHRVIDGAVGARFLQTLKEMLEEPATSFI
ncbi:MAG: dihydrolipoamide acyltransferase [Gemmatimonadetes bacterium]|nr:dihydrolipoamide acyltransferase [Gemmatimonadota bacterium]